MEAILKLEEFQALERAAGNVELNCDVAPLQIVVVPEIIGTVLIVALTAIV